MKTPGYACDGCGRPIEYQEVYRLETLSEKTLQGISADLCEHCHRVLVESMVGIQCQNLTTTKEKQNAGA